MEQDFPKGKLKKAMSDKHQGQFHTKMKTVIWAIKAVIDGDESGGTGFCIHKDGLLLTVSHLFTWKPDDDQKTGTVAQSEVKECIQARRDLDEDNAFCNCEIVYKWEHFDLALLKVNVDGETSGGFKGFDYASIEDISRKLPLGMEVFSIGLYHLQGFHCLSGVLAYKAEQDSNDYHSLGKDKEFTVGFPDIENSNLYVDKAGLMGNIEEDRCMHPGIKYLSFDFGMSGLGGMSGAPIFNPKGKVISIVQLQQSTVKGLSPSALLAFVESYLETLENE